MRLDPFLDDPDRFAVGIEFLFHRSEVREVLTFISVAVMNRPAFDHKVLQHLRVLFFGFLEPEGKTEPLFTAHLPIRICLCHRAAMQKKRAPGAVPAWGRLQYPCRGGGQIVELPLARARSEEHT